MAKTKILVVDDDPAVRFAIRDFLELHGHLVEEAETLAEAEAKYRADVFDAVTLDYALPDGNGLDLLPRLRAIDAGVPVILLTAHGSIELAVRAIQLGADQFLVKPLNLPALLMVVERALENQRNRRKQVASLSRDRPARELDLFLGTSPAIRKLEAQARRAAEAESPVLITGATGTGKSELARWLHRHSPRAAEPMLELNCGGFAKDLLESELFGHEKGAFTGAVAAKVGLMEAAHRGTLFLDEIGDMDLQVQPRILKAVEEKRFRRLGEVGDRKVDFRLIAATHQDLDALVRARQFRADLFYRVSTIQMVLPPLCERLEDLPVLAQNLLRLITQDWAREPVQLSRAALEGLGRHAWPGNVRELRNVLERAMMNTDEHRLEPSDFSGLVKLPLGPDPGRPGPAEGMSYVEALAEAEKRILEGALKAAQGKAVEAARRLGMSRATFYRRMNDLQARSQTWDVSQD